MRFGSLFSGIGGIDLGLEWAGFERSRWQVETDTFCQRRLARHWPDTPRFGDVRDCGASNLAPVDLIAGGFPCQDISVAGSGAGLHGARSSLWFEFLRVVYELRPRWVLIENVPGLRTRGGDTVLDGLGTAGYAAWPLVVGARHVGANHRRDRVWIVANAKRDGLEGRIYPFAGERASGVRRRLADACREGLADPDGQRCERERLAEHGIEQGAPGRELERTRSARTVALAGAARRAAAARVGGAASGQRRGGSTIGGSRN